MKWPTKFSDQLSLHQNEKLRKATASSLGILSGGPGSGKTFCAAHLIKALAKAIGGYSQIAVAGPTGKSAVRVTEVMQSYDIPIVARTIHSLLKVESSSDCGWSFAFNCNNTLPFQAIVIDEMSMVDTDLASSLFAARARGTLILLIGDPCQLPPVGHGAPLRDMIAAGVPYGELTEIHRNDGGIVQACKDMREGRTFQPGGNLEMFEASTPAQQFDAMLETIDDKAKTLDVDPVWDVQVLCAINKKSTISRRELNKRLQTHLNQRPAIAGSPFKLHDKIVCTQNSHFPCQAEAMRQMRDDPNVVFNKRRQVYVANGEIGEVLEVEPKRFLVQLQAPWRQVVVPRGEMRADPENPAGDEEGEVDEVVSTGCNWDLAYSISVHKAQGSEWSVVLYMIDEGAKRLVTREHVYTGISRAKKSCVMIGKLAVAQAFTQRTAIDKRKTFLRELIQQGVK